MTTKLTKLYEGSALGTRCQVAVREDRAFVRYWRAGFRGHFQWSKWTPFVAEYPDHVYSKIEGQEHVRYPVEIGSRVSVGFSDLPLISTSAHVRLPV
jgi:hypothetical protein